MAVGTILDENAKSDLQILQTVETFLASVSTLEQNKSIPIVIFQDGVNGAYYVKCSLLASELSNLCDLNARLDLNNPESLRANRELLLLNKTYIKMEEDAARGREFNDIIVEYNTQYNPSLPLKVWGGQHRVSAIKHKGVNSNRHHGFRIYFNLTPKQRTEVALISNTNISVSNDTFDRMIEETEFGDRLKKWCQLVSLLENGEDFPDVGSHAEKITVKFARSFIVNFYLGNQRGTQLKADELDRHVYEPYSASTGPTVDPKYAEIMGSRDILSDNELIEAGKAFAALHKAQYHAITKIGGSINRKAFRNKALVDSVLCGWSYVAGLLQFHPQRLRNHYKLPQTNNKVTDPLNAKDMSEFKHDSDLATYRGLGTRSSAKDRQRIAQLFLAKSREDSVAIDKAFMHKAVSQVVGILNIEQGYL